MKCEQKQYKMGDIYLAQKLTVIFPYFSYFPLQMKRFWKNKIIANSVFRKSHRDFYGN